MKPARSPSVSLEPSTSWEARRWTYVLAGSTPSSVSLEIRADDHPQIIEVLTAYLREHARWRCKHPENATSRHENEQPPADALAAAPDSNESEPDTERGSRS